MWLFLPTQTTQEVASTFIFVQHNVTIHQNITLQQTGVGVGWPLEWAGMWV